MVLKRAFSLVLALVLVFSCLALNSLADSTPPLYVSLGDSIARGSVEEDTEQYNYVTDCYAGLFADYLRADLVNYAGLGMQTIDVLYMIDDEFRGLVDSGLITMDSWHPEYYPPYNGIALDTVMNDIRNADYISLCIGGGDVVAYPGELKSRALEKIADEDEAKAKLQELLDNGSIGKETLDAFNTLMQIYPEKTIATLRFVIDIIDGYSDYSEYFPRIVKCLRSENKDAEIFLIGLFIPAGTLSFLLETDDASPIVFYLNRLLDNINVEIKKAAITYNCYYIDTMGIDSSWHPTPLGYSQICDRMISVLEGDHTYSGGISSLSKINASVNRFYSKIFTDFYFGPGSLKSFLLQTSRTITARLIAFINI